MSNSSKEVVLRCNGLGKKFSRDLKSSLKYAVADIAKDLISPKRSKSCVTEKLRKDEFWALQDISFELRRGECLGLLGRNGAGKSTLLRILSGILKQDYGNFEVNGSIGGIIALGAGFNPVLTGRENLKVYAAIKGISQKILRQKEEEIIEFSEIGNFIDSPFRTYSSGMQVRLAFSAAAILHVPEVLLLDEVLAVGDISFIGKCYNHIEKFKQSNSIIMVSHNMTNINRFCDRVVLLEKGTIIKPQEKKDKGIFEYLNLLKNNNKFENILVHSDCNSNKYIDISTKSATLSITFKEIKDFTYIELTISREGNSSCIIYFNVIVNRKPLISNIKSNSTINVELENIPTGSYSLTMSTLDKSFNYINRYKDFHAFYLNSKIETEAFTIKRISEN